MLNPRIVILGGVLALVAAGAWQRRSRAPTAAPATRAEAARAPAPLPERLADTGLYADFAAGEIAADVLPFAPQYPLWTDGATKRRWIRLPAGTSIDASDPDAWVFPAGTKLWKEFSFGRRVETRMIELGADGAWRFASYAWTEDGRDARLVAERGARGVAETAPGAKHDIPSRLDCLACHEGGRSKVLGFSALQLSSDRDPLAPHAEPIVAGAIDLPQLVERGLVRNLPSQLLAHPPRIEAATPRERAALGYLHANCGHCHNEAGPLATLGLSFEHRLHAASDDHEPAIATTLGVTSRFRTACGHENARITAGEPDASVVVGRLSSRNPVQQMPPLGTHVVDEQAKQLIVDWIRTDLGPARSGPTRFEPMTRNETRDQPRNKE